MAFECRLHSYINRLHAKHLVSSSKALDSEHEESYISKQEPGKVHIYFNLTYEENANKSTETITLDPLGNLCLFILSPVRSSSCELYKADYVFSLQ